MKKIIYIFIFLFITFYLSLKPEFFLRNKIVLDNISINSYKAIDYDFQFLLNDIKNISNKENIKIFIISSKFSYLFFSYFSKSDVYVNPLTGYVIVSPIKIENNNIVFNDSKIANFEIIKKSIISSIRLSMPFLSYITLDKWKMEGYSEYASKDLPLFFDKDLCLDNKDKNFEKFKNYILIKYLIENEKLSLKNILEENYSRDAVLKNAKMIYCK